jgi:hypothetical protein
MKYELKQVRTRWNVVDRQTGERANKHPLAKADAEGFCERLNEGAAILAGYGYAPGSSTLFIRGGAIASPPADTLNQYQEALVGGD